MKGLDNVTDQQQDNIDNRLVYGIVQSQKNNFFLFKEKKKNLFNENQL